MGVWWESGEHKQDEAERFLFPWEKRGVVSCEFQYDDGYDGVIVRLNLPPDAVPVVRETAMALGGGVGQA
jgi:hypothetical protein